MIIHEMASKLTAEPGKKITSPPEGGLVPVITKPCGFESVWNLKIRVVDLDEHIAASVGLAVNDDGVESGIEDDVSDRADGIIISQRLRSDHG